MYENNAQTKEKTFTLPITFTIGWFSASSGVFNGTGDGNSVNVTIGHFDDKSTVRVATYLIRTGGSVSWVVNIRGTLTVIGL